MAADRRPLLVDVMGTLVHDPFYREIPAFFGVSLEELLRVKHPTAWREFEEGRIDEATALDRMFADGRAYDQAGLKACVRDAYAWLAGVEDLLAEMRAAGLEMHVLSNYPSWHELIEERLGLSRYLPWTFVSWRTGVRKPDPEAYRLPARELGVAPADLVLIDDRDVNCAAARELGLDAIRFESAGQLRAELGARGLL